MIGASLLSGIIEMQYLGGAADTESVFERLLAPAMATSTTNIFTLGYSVVATSPIWIGALWEAFWFDYAMFTGVWQIVRWLFVAVNLGVIVSLVLALRGTSSS